VQVMGALVREAKSQGLGRVILRQAECFGIDFFPAQLHARSRLPQHFR